MYIALFNAAFVQERPIDTVVDGFVHLQQYHVTEIAHGLSGLGSYRLRQGFPLCNKVTECTKFTIKPDEIVATLQKPIDEVKKMPLRIVTDVIKTFLTRPRLQKLLLKMLEQTCVRPTYYEVYIVIHQGLAEYRWRPLFKFG